MALRCILCDRCKKGGKIADAFRRVESQAKDSDTKICEIVVLLYVDRGRVRLIDTTGAGRAGDTGT